MRKTGINIGVIPARLGSTRFPGKILAPLAGKPLVLHAYEQALKATRLDEVIIAVDDEQTKTILERFEARVVMTGDHQSGTDRVAEVVAEIDARVVVNVQGDEPLLDPQIIDNLVDVFNNPAVEMATAATRDLSVEDLLNPNVVKVFLNQFADAEDFKRLVADHMLGGCYRHIGIYAFRKESLLYFTGLVQSEREKKLQLEQMRALDNEIPIRTILSNFVSHGVDTAEDLELVDDLLKHSAERNLHVG